MNVIFDKNNNRIPIKIWSDNVDDGTIEQAINLSNLPFAYKWISLMPDCHKGYGMPIGGVIATKDVIIPAAVGVDIGCGMNFIETTTNADELSDEIIDEIIAKIYKKIPVGKNHNKKKTNHYITKYIPVSQRMDIVLQELESAKYQLCSLGGGNHFIELQKNDKGKLCVMLHSGSRNIGYKIASHYLTLAKELNKKWYSVLGEESDLNFLPIDTPEGQEYINAQEFALNFAKINRELMLNKVSKIINKILNKNKIGFDIEKNINIHHNYATKENHYGQNVWVHRKGAIMARKGVCGIIPGSMGHKSYITVGKGNPESFCSASHGAGRKMGRKEFMKKCSKEEAEKSMPNKHYQFKNDWSEAPGAYKDIDTVIKEEKDLVDIVQTLTPIKSVKDNIKH